MISEHNINQESVVHSLTEKEKKKALRDLTERLEKILQLQDVCNRLGELEKEINILSEQTNIEEQKYKSKQTQYENNLKPLERVENEYKETEAEILEVQKKIEKCEDTKKKIKTIKEFKALNKEIDFLNQQSAMKENQILSKKDEIDFRRNKLETIKENLLEIEKGFQEKKAEYDQLLDERKEDIKTCQQEKAQIESKIEKAWINIFNRIYENKDQLAIVAATPSTAEENYVCQGCFTMLTRQVEVTLKVSLSIMYCPFCSRILYATEMLEKVS